MRLMLIRHAAAVPYGTPGIADADRPLTPEGERRFIKAAQGLASLTAPPELILTSPLPRARRTAEIAAAAWGGVRMENAEELVEGRQDALIALIARQASLGRLALVGHEPSLSGLLAWLLGTPRAGVVDFKKGGVAMLEVGEPPSEGGCLLWFLAPKVLRALGDACP